MATKAERERTAAIDAGLRGTPGKNAKPPMTEEEIVAERDRVIHGQKATPAAKESETAGNTPDMPVQ